MCGRYSFVVSRKQIEEELGIVEFAEEPVPNYNVAPTQKAYVVTNAEPGCVQAFYWGLLPFWSRESKPDARLINARRETIAQKPSFRHAFRSRRCWVLADSFYEWKKEGKARHPFRIMLKGSPIMVMAGIWEVHGSGPQALHTCSIITTESNRELTSLHDRTPAFLLNEEQRRQWLDLEDAASLQHLLDPPPDGILDIYAVSPFVNNVRNNGEALHQPAEGLFPPDRINKRTGV